MSSIAAWTAAYARAQQRHILRSWVDSGTCSQIEKGMLVSFGECVITNMDGTLQVECKAVTFNLCGPEQTWWGSQLQLQLHVPAAHPVSNTLRSFQSNQPPAEWTIDSSSHSEQTTPGRPNMTMARSQRGW